jgi:subtilisin family serine protease
MRRTFAVLTVAAAVSLSLTTPATAAPARLDSGIRVFDDAVATQLPEIQAESAGAQTAAARTRAWVDPELLGPAALDAGDGAELDLIVELAAVPADGVAASSLAAVDDVERVQRRFAGWGRTLGARQIRGLSHFALLNVRLPAASLSALAALPGVTGVYRNNPVYANRVQGGEMIGAYALQGSKGANGQGVGVAVLDTGVEYYHPELDGFFRAGGDFSGGDNFDDFQGHGTAVSGIIHALAPQAHLFAFKVLDDEGRGSNFTVLSGLNATYALRKNFGGIHVVNLSLGGGGPVNKDCDKGHYANTVLNNLHKAGIVVVYASGNNAFLNGVSADSCHSKVISVGAVYDGSLGGLAFTVCEDETTRARQITCYSNSGKPLDVLAPSHNAITTSLQGSYTETFGGTSAAAPYVAGVIAQLRSRLPKASPAAIRGALMSTGINIRDINGITRRLINAAAAYKKLGGK